MNFPALAIIINNQEQDKPEHDKNLGSGPKKTVFGPKMLERKCRFISESRRFQQIVNDRNTLKMLHLGMERNTELLVDGGDDTALELEHICGSG